MLIRALIVLLLVLNLGVAAWWALRDIPTPMVTAELPSDVAKLVLVKERATAGSTAPAATSAPVDAKPPVTAMTASPATPSAAPPADATTTPATAAAVQCFSYGPFLADEDIARARSELKPLVLALVERTPSAGVPRAWRVLLPPFASLDEVQATAERVNAAGFKDYFVVREGAEANSLALGRFASESAARRHVAALVAAGFPARAEPIGVAGSARWLDVRAAAGFNAAAAQSDAGAREHRPIDCAAVR